MSFMRLFHASPDAPAVDVYANGVIVGENLEYREFTEYFRIMPGHYNVKIYPAGQKTNMVLETFINIQNSSINTLAIIGTLDDLTVKQILEPKMSINRNKAYLRVAHLAPDAPGVDVALPDGTVLFSSVDYKEVTGYQPLDPSTYKFQVRLAGTEDVVMTIPNITLDAMRMYTLYIVGLVDSAQGLEAVLALDGNTYLQV